MNFAIVSRGLWCLALALCVSPVVAEPAASDPFGGGAPAAREYTFADFCRENPTLNQPVGADPVWVEWLVAEGPALPDQPTPEMLQTGRLVRQVTRSNRCANTEQWQLIDRAPNGRALANPRRIGSALFTRVLKLKDGSIDLGFHTALVPPPTWIEADGAIEPGYRGSEGSSKVTVHPGEWTKVGGTSEEQVTRTADGKETRTKSSQASYLRVLLKPPALTITH